jgi:ABC-2 type transport system ATP-binding protein
MIQIESLHKHYGTLHALDGLNMTVEPGVVYGFLGPNGAGKTTTLRILTGLAHPTSGRVMVAGVDVISDGHILSHRIGYLPEEPAFYPWLTPREYLDMLGRLHHLDNSFCAVRVKELLELVNLADAGKRHIAGFSHGMRQRLGLAAALIHKPEVLLLDEPVSALDPSGRKEVLEFIETLSGQCTILMSSHILADVERICNVVGIIARGRMIVQSPREALMDRYAQPIFEAEGEDPGAIQRWADVIRPQNWVTAVKLDGERIRVTVSDVKRARRELLVSAVAQQVALRHYEEVRPSLEDVFLQLVDKETNQ